MKKSIKELMEMEYMERLIQIAKEIGVPDESINNCDEEDELIEKLLEYEDQEVLEKQYPNCI